MLKNPVTQIGEGMVRRRSTSCGKIFLEKN